MEEIKEGKMIMHDPKLRGYITIPEWIAVFLLLLMLPAPGFAEVPAPSPQSVPEEGIKAEMAGQWDKAIGVYRSALDKSPGRGDLWMRISDIEAKRGNHGAAAEALNNASRAYPNNGSLHYKMSAAYAAANQPAPALKAIERALELEPYNPDYLRSGARLASWNGRYDQAAEYYKRLSAVAPGEDMRLNMARAEAWGGQLDRSACDYRAYLDAHPEDKDARLEYVKVEAWRGNFAKALEELEAYRQKFGETEAYQNEKGRVLASADRPAAALELILPALGRHPEDYELNFSRVIALRYAERMREASEGLATLTRLRPDAKETLDIKRFVLTPLRSWVRAGFSFYSDSDDIDIFGTTLDGGYIMRPETALLAGIAYDYLRSDKGTGLENIDGSRDAHHLSGQIGIINRFSSQLAVDAYIGAAEAEDHSSAIYGLGADIRPGDNFRFRLERTYGYFVVSPRAVSKGIRRSDNRLTLVWEPDLRYTVEAAAAYDTFSDDNTKWEVVFAPRRAVVRSERLNLDLGIGAWLFGYDDDLDNGYYDPELYQRYMLTSFWYWKISDDDGMGLVLGAGIHKDDSMGGFRFAANADLEGTFGLYRDWMLKFQLSGLHNVRQESGAHNGYRAAASITRRF